uniref:Uncharacterized protein LOC104213654 n=1 Tax=Nicotiana sylvestris TaxID=4096 RepID=A0A1U7V936_NICSY|nr:PREDICTED: uncharacterized protein LOC104213654 [Nicotiana sylvestris]
MESFAQVGLFPVALVISQAGGGAQTLDTRTPEQMAPQFHTPVAQLVRDEAPSSTSEIGSRNLKGDGEKGTTNLEAGVHMIIGGANVPQGPVSKRVRTSTTEEWSARERLPGEILLFSEEDLEAMMEPHNDALVISFLSYNTRIKRVLVDPGISVNIIKSEVVEQLGLLNQVVPTPRVLHGFNMVGEEMKGEIVLLIDTSGTTQNT